jgi:Flavin containing amine oxidoreductase/NAD(P)-binding Rossmann-like domain
MSPGPPRVAVIGGGLAGITAAIALAEAGAAVTLLEARPRLGGATCSFSRDGLTVDTGQHIFLGCCTAYRDLLGKLGMTEHAPIQDRFDVSVLAPGASPRRGRLRRTALPGPLHMLPALGRYPFLSLSERTSVARPALAMRFVDPACPGVDEQRFGDWLAARGQSERARRALWDLFTVSALNIAGDDASLSLAAIVVKTGLLGKNNAADIGVPTRPLGELHGDAGATLLTNLGARVLLNAKVSAIEPGAIEPGGDQDARFRIRLARPADADAASDAAPSADAVSAAAPSADAVSAAAPSADAVSAAAPSADARPSAGAAEILADAVVLAVPHEAAARLIPPGALPDATVAGWAGLGASPIVNVHVIYDRPVMDEPFAAAIDSPVQWVFDRTRISGLDRRPPPDEPDETRVSAGSNEVKPGFHLAAGGAAGGPQYLAISLSAADEYVDVPAAALREQFIPALAELFPAAREAQVTEFFVTRERRATFRQAPGTARLRPAAATNLPGLVLAGAWTATGWPDTMESAVRSGLAAAIELRRTVISVPGHPASGHPGTGYSASGHPGTGYSASGHPDAGHSASGHPDTGYSDSVLSGSEANATTSTIGERQ